MLTLTPTGGSGYGNAGMSALKSISFFLLFAGIVLVSIGYIQQEKINKPPIVQYRYVPRSFQEEQETSVPILSTFSKMFSDRGPWQKYHSFSDVFPWQQYMINSRVVLPYNNPSSGFGRAVGTRVLP